MKDKNVSEIQKLIGLPEYTLLHHASNRAPLQAWVPPPGRPLFSANELYNLFAHECLAFAGDSTARRAADTLHYVIEHRNDSSFSYFNFLYNWTRVQGYHTRVIGRGDPSLESEQYYKTKCEPGTIDNIWKPQLQQFMKFEYNKNHSVVLAGAGAWDLKNNKQNGPRELLEHQVNETIHNLHKSMPPSVLILWKSIPFNRNSQWGYIQSNETVERGHRGINCLIYHANMVAKREILRINSRRLVFVDWAKEVFPHMYWNSTFNLMLPENSDNNPWHFGPVPRGLLLQMLAWEVHSWRSYQKHNTSPYENADLSFNHSFSITTLPHLALNRAENWRWNGALNIAVSKSIMQGTIMQAVGVILLVFIGTIRIIRSELKRG